MEGAGHPVVTRAWHDERGESAITAVFGVFIFLVMMLFAVQITTHLAFSSRLSALTFDAASAVARGEESCGSATSRLEGRTTRWSGSTSCRVQGENVVVTMSGDSPALVIATFGRVLSLDSVRRSAIVRVEELTP